jgi:hypothetical protein
MDVIKTETASDGDDDPVSLHEETLPLVAPISKAESHVSTFTLGMAGFLQALGATL